MAIYDCFTFFNEIDLLEIRLGVLDAYVDKFIIVELSKTFRGGEKDLLFAKNKKRFREYQDKIIYITDDYVPAYKGDGSFNIEYYQRNLILKGLNRCEPDDIIIISDIDEIPNPAILFDSPVRLDYRHSEQGKIRNLKTLMYEFSLNQKELVKKIIKGDYIFFYEWLEYTPIALEQSLFYYYMNCKSKAKWYGPVITKFKNMDMPQRLRDKRNLFPFIRNAGWHFSYLGGLSSVKEKLHSIVDQNPEIVKKLDRFSSDDAYIENCLKNGVDILARKGKQFEYEFIDYSKVGLSNIEIIKNNYAYLFKN